MPARFRSMPRPIRFGGVPTGVPTPPMEAAKVSISISRRAKRRTPAGLPAALSVRCVTIESAMGNSIAAVAVLLIHIESAVATAPKVNQDPRGALRHRRPASAE